MKHFIRLVVAVDVALVGAFAPFGSSACFAQANVGVYVGPGVPSPVPQHQPPVIYQQQYSAPGAPARQGTYQSPTPSAVYRAPPVIYGPPPAVYGDGRGYGYSNGYVWHGGRGAQPWRPHDDD